MRGAKKGERRGGRQKGSLNKASQALREAVAATGLTPHQIMIDNMRRAYAQALEVEANLGAEMLKGADDPQEQFERILTEVKRAIGFRAIAQDCAKDAAPYSHSRLANVEAAVTVDGKLIVEIVQFASDQNTPQLGAPALSAEGMGLPGKGSASRKPAGVLSLASPQRKG